MRLDDLFKQVISEAPGDNLNTADRRTILISPAEIYQMTGQTPPQVKGPGGRMVQPDGWYDKVEMPVGGKGGVNPKIATMHKRWVKGGRVPGLIWDEDNQSLKPYNENNILEDLGWQIAAGAVETASAVTKGGAKVIDDTLSVITVGGYENNKLLKKTMASSEIVDGKREYDEFVLDKFQNWLESNTDQQFRDNIDATAGAVNSFGDIGTLFMGGIPGGWEGALGIMASELPSEILDIGLMVAGGGYGLAASGALNALEAGGAAASEIQKRIDTAYDKGILQAQPQYQVMLQAAQQQLSEDENFSGSDDELNARAANMAREQLTHSAINRAFYAVAATGGVLDTVQNKIIYGGPIKPNFLKNAFAKAIIAPGTEAISEMGEQWVQNLGIRSAAGKITTQGEGVINAGWNGWIAGHTATVVGTTADAIGTGNKMQKAARARLRQFFFGGSKDTQALIDVMGMDPNTLITNVTDSEGKLRLAEMVKERGLKTLDDLSPADQKAMKRMFFAKKEVQIDGETYTLGDLRKNSKNLQLLQLMSNIDIDPKENVAVVMFKNDNEIRKTAELLGIDNTGNINKVMAELEEVRKIDVRIEGKSKLEAPVWSELNQRQQEEYIQTGTIKFVGDPERGTQTWTRSQIMFNSRRNNDSVPAEIANMLDNTTARPDINSEEYADIKQDIAIAQQTLDSYKTRATRELGQRQKAWDSRNPDADPNNPDNPRPTEQNDQDYISVMNIANGIAGPGVAAKMKIDSLRKSVNQDQKQWDQEYSDTHTADGVVIVTRPKETETNPKFNARPDALDLPSTSASNTDSQDDADNIDIDTTITSTDLTKNKIKPPVVLSTNQDDSLSRAHIVANAKIAIANGNMEQGAVNAMIESLETTYPGINTEILPDGIDSYKQNPTAQVTKIQAETKENIVPEEVPRNGKPPKGSIATVDGQQYKFLGAMWAPIKPDGSTGSTGHQNHKKLNKAWSDNIIDTTAPGELQTYDINDDGSVNDADNIDIDTTAPVPVNVGAPPGQPKTTSTVTSKPVIPKSTTAPKSTTTPSLGTPKIGTAPNVTNLNVSPSVSSGGTTTQMRTVNQAVANIQNADPRFNNPQAQSALQQYLEKNPKIAQQAANDDRAPGNIKNSKIVKTLSKTFLGRVLGPISMILSPTTAGDGTFSDSQRAADQFYQDLLKNNPVALKNILDSEIDKLEGQDKIDAQNDSQYKAVSSAVTDIQNQVARNNDAEQQKAAGPNTNFGTVPQPNFGRGTPPTADQSAERARIAQAKLDKIKADTLRQANDQYQNDKIDAIATKSDAQAKADAQTRASDANLIAKAQAKAKADAEAKAKEKADKELADKEKADKELADKEKEAEKKRKEKEKDDQADADNIGLDTTGVLAPNFVKPVDTTSKTQKKTDIKKATDTKPVQSKITSKDQQKKKKPRVGFGGAGDDTKKKPRPLPTANPIKFADPLKLGKYQTFGQNSLFK